jgi:hypothetical protein
MYSILAGVKQDIEFDYYYLTKDKMNRETTIVIKGMDGILYGFVRRQKKASDKNPTFFIKRWLTVA